MRKINSIKEAKKRLLEGEVLVYKPYDQQVTYLTLKNENRITKFNMNLRYNISLEELEEIFNENTLYLYEKNNDIEINQEFKKLIQ